MLSAVTGFLNSNFISAFAGAIAGAGAATMFAARTERRRRIRDEIVACNVAIGQCVSIANSYIAIKRQNIAPLCAKYFQDRASLIGSGIRAVMGQPVEMRFRFDLYTLTAAWTPIDALNGTINSRISSAAT